MFLTTFAASNINDSLLGDRYLPDTMLNSERWFNGQIRDQVAVPNGFYTRSLSKACPLHLLRQVGLPRRPCRFFFSRYPRPVRDDVFPETMWTLVLAAAERGEPERARTAFHELCSLYRAAIAHWMRLQRLTPEDAEDATHDFLAQWLERENPLQRFQRGERRFREFLRVCLRRFLADWHARRRAERRGGDVPHISWEHDEVVEDTSDTVPIIDLALARDTQARALRKLAESWQTQIPGVGLDRLRVVALGEVPNPGYHSLARELGVPIGTLKGWVFRLRRDYYEAFRDTVRQQADPALVDEEVLYLHSLLFRAPPPVTEEFPQSPQPPQPDSR